MGHNHNSEERGRERNCRVSQSGRRADGQTGGKRESEYDGGAGEGDEERAWEYNEDCGGMQRTCGVA